ncbi:hypothetical protein [Bradyrhizobium ontarionense]|nr:hypothetical protein [Bradyrhizobium sp. A19]
MTLIVALAQAPAESRQIRSALAAGRALRSVSRAGEHCNDHFGC